MNEGDRKHDPQDPTPYWWKIEKKALMSDIRLLVIASVALNQFLSNVSLPDGISTAAITAAIFAPAVKAIATSMFGR